MTGLFATTAVGMVNLIGVPYSGKTKLAENLMARLPNWFDYTDMGEILRNRELSPADLERMASGGQLDDSIVNGEMESRLKVDPKKVFLWNGTMRTEGQFKEQFTMLDELEITGAVTYHLQCSRLVAYGRFMKGLEDGSRNRADDKGGVEKAMRRYDLGAENLKVLLPLLRERTMLVDIDANQSEEAVLKDVMRHLRMLGIRND
jgi:adenylate kinase family enzyme